MVKLIFGVIVGVLSAWLSSREGALDQVRQRAASAPAPLRERAQSVTWASATGAARLRQVVESAPVPPRVKSRAQAVLSAVQPGRQSPGTTGEAAQSAAEASVSLAAETMIPDEVLAEQDVAARAAQEAQQEKQAGG